MGEQLSDKQWVVGSNPTFCKTNLCLVIKKSEIERYKHRNWKRDSCCGCVRSWSGARCSDNMGRQLSRQQQWTENPRVGGSSPPWPTIKTGIRRSIASQFPFCGTLSLCFHFMPPHKIQRAMAAGSVSFSIYLEIYRNKNYYIAESFYIQARSGLFFTLLFSNI